MQPKADGSREDDATPQQQGERAGAAALRGAAEGAIAARAALTPEMRDPYPQPETGDTGDEGTAVVPSMSSDKPSEGTAAVKGVVRPRDESISEESGCHPAKRAHVG